MLWFGAEKHQDWRKRRKTDYALEVLIDSGLA
jgi:hypothetical protein